MNFAQLQRFHLKIEQMKRVQKGMQWVAALLLAVFGWSAQAQVSGGVRGSVTDNNTSAPMEYVTVRVFREQGNTLVKGAITDENGAFHIKGLPEGSYKILLTYTGYDSLSKTFSVTSVTPEANLQKLAMSPSSRRLKGVKVTTQRAQMSLEVDKKVFNVDQTLTAAGSSASELLETIPSVEVDNEGSISLRGNTNVTIWIDGKPSGLTADNQGQILEQMPADNIEKIEVITNPSAKYSPEGTTGIINIILKKDKRKGYYGSVQAGGSTDDNGRLGTSLNANINYNSKRWDLYANMGLRSHVFARDERTLRTNLDSLGKEVSYLNQEAENVNRGMHLFARGGATYHWTDNDQFNLDLMGNFGGRSGSSHNRYTSNVLGLYDTSWRNSDQDDHNRGGSASFGYQHKFSATSTLDALATYNQWNMANVHLFEQSYDRNYATDTAFQRQESDIQTRFWTLQTDYVNRFSDKMKWEAGYKGEWQNEESPVQTFAGNARNSLVENQSLYNDFFYERNVQALYTTFSHQIAQFSYQLGLRGEYTGVKTQSLGFGQTRATVPTYDTSYLDFFPSVFLSYHLPANNEIQLNYTRRISRPRGPRLNPFINMEDSMNLSFGNPYLLPEYSNTLEFNYLKNWKQHTVSVSLYHRSTDNVIQRIRYREGQVMKSTHVNVAHETNTGLELIAKNTLFKAVDLTTTVNFYYHEMDAFTYRPEGATSDVCGEAGSDFAWNARMVGSVALPQNFSLQLTGRYDAPRLVAQGQRMANYSVDAGLRKSFCNRKLNVNLSVRDLFNTQSWHTITSGDGFYQDYEGKWGRHFNLTVAYQFGNMNARPEMKKQQDASSGYEDSYDM